MYNICNKFSETFTEEIINIKHVCSTKFLDRNQYLTESNVSFRFMPVTGDIACNVINRLKSDKAPGLDGIRIEYIKIIKNLANIGTLNQHVIVFVQRGYPNMLRKALNKPIYKGGAHSNNPNYRPIAILSDINKIVEKVVIGQISDFLEKNHIALTQFSKNINDSLNQGHPVLAVFIDYKKAFGTLNHEILLQAMEEPGPEKQVAWSLPDWQNLADSCR